MQPFQNNTGRLRIFDPQPFLRRSARDRLEHCSCRILPVIFSLLTVLSQAQASHPISVTEAQIFVTQQSARARIQLFAEDLLLFQGLEPDDEGILSPAELKRGLELHRSFLTERVTLRDVDGNLIPSKVTDVVPFEIPDDGIPEEDLMLYQATYELEFRFESPPEFLTFQQDITDENFILPSEMKLAIHQTGSGNIIAGTLQPGGAVTHRFDWKTPLDPAASDEEYETWLEKQRQETLGITSYSSVYSFIYIEPGEVRHEVLIPLASLASILPIQQADPAFLEIAEQEAARVLVQEWLSKDNPNPARINGVDVHTEFSRIDFYGLSLRDFAQQADARRVSFASGRVGIILRYVPADHFVKDVELSWDTFQSSMRKIRSVIVPWQGELERFEFSRFKTKDDNIYRWSAAEDAIPDLAEPVPRQLPGQPRLRVPVASCVLAVYALLLLTVRRWQSAVVCLVLAAACWPIAGTEIVHPFLPTPRLSAEETRHIVQSLQTGTYQALDFGLERRIYDALEQFVDGELLESLYLQLRDGLAVKEQGGAVARVLSVDYVDGNTVDSSGDLLEWPGFQFRSTWVVAGTVEHWGHVHERRNQFSAVLNVEPRDSCWKITNMQIDAQESLPGTTRLRKFQD
jgi:hypothetical protein